MKNKTIFDDRREVMDRRKQHLPMPHGLDRRKNSRRCRQFSAKPWWLNIGFADELVSERALAAEYAARFANSEDLGRNEDADSNYRSKK